MASQLNLIAAKVTELPFINPAFENRLGFVLLGHAAMLALQH
jgi:hypothetical protein